MDTSRISGRHLEIFMTVMTSSTLVETAEKLMISQPAVSKAIRQMENEIALPLFERIHGRLVPTPFAMRLLPHAQAAVDQLRTAQRMFRNIADRMSGHITIATTSTALATLVPDAARIVREKWSQTTFDIVPELIMHDVLEQVVSRRVDIGICHRTSNEVDPLSVHLCECTELCSHAMAVAFPAGHSLERSKVIRPADLRDIPIIRIRSELSTQSFVDAAFRRAKVSLMLVAEVGSSFAVANMVRAGLGVGLLNPMQLAAGTFTDIRVRPFSPRINIKTAAYHLSASPLTEQAQCFLKCLLQVGAALQSE